MLFNPLDYTTVFLSYDEPNCEKNYQHLLTLNPQALRVHGVTGSDKAHKECAKIAQTENVIIVDGDNFVKHYFYDTKIELPESVDLSTNVLSYSGRNSINGLQYGNGGIKVWPNTKILTMKTHEASEGQHIIDFDCKSYVELNTVGSDANIHSSPAQAFRSGYREGIKLMLENEKPMTLSTIDKYNFDRLWMWCHVGSDVVNGYYAIYGARLALAEIVSGKLNHLMIRDQDYVNSKMIECDLKVLNLLGKEISHPFFGNVLDSQTSKRIRENYINPKRSTIDYQSNRFIEWCEGFRECAKTKDSNIINMLCTTGRDKPYGIDRINGAKAAINFDGYSVNLYDYVWLKEKYENLVIR